MGGAASTNPGHSEIVAASGSNKSNKTNQISDENIPTSGIKGDLNPTLFNTEESSDGMISSYKMRKLALGIQGYKDRDREYDSTLSSLECNKTAQKEWSDPKDGLMSPTLRAAKAQLTSPNPSPAKSKTNDNFFPADSKSFGSGNNSNNNTRVQPSSSSRNSSEPPSPGNDQLMPKRSGYDIRAGLQPRGIVPSSPGPPPSNGMSGPPPGIVVRPFPGRPRPLGEPDEDNSNFANFSSENLLLKTNPRPQQVPQLSLSSNSNQKPLRSNIASPGPTAISSPVVNSFQQPGRGPPGLPMNAPPRMIAPIGLGPSSNPNTPHVMASQGGQVNQVIIARPPTSAAPLPVVKETKDVKRNKVQLPSKLTHAKPTTGDWLNKRYIVNNYILLDNLGTGSYGEVRLCKDRTTEKLFAIKIISKDFLKKKKNGKTTETYFEDIKREIAIMKKLLHPNILRLYEVLDDPKVNKMYLVLEYMKKGDLINILKKAATDNSAENQGGFIPLTDYDCWQIFRQLISGIRYLHYANIVHGDIKPQNLLLGEDGIVKIADFGISQMLSGSGEKLEDAAGTPAFMAPELIESKSFSGQKADIWAIGATMFMLRFGNPPFVAKSIINLYNKICNDPLVFPSQINPTFKNLLEGLLDKDPEKRLTLDQIVAHPWYREKPPVTISAVSAPSKTSCAQKGNNIDSKSQNPKGTLNDLKPLHIPDVPTDGVSQSQTLSFQPPPSYTDEEERAMKEPIQSVNVNELFMSIGGIRVGSDSDMLKDQKNIGEVIEENIDEENDFIDEEVEIDDDDEDYDDEGESKNNAFSSKGNLLKTNWGADVFQIVQDEDDADDDGDDVDVDSDIDESSDEESAKAIPKKRILGKHIQEPSQSKFFDSKDDDNSNKESHHQMSAEEEARRSNQFKRKIANKSSSNMYSAGVRNQAQPKSTMDSFNNIPSSSASSSNSLSISSPAPKPKVFKPSNSGNIHNFISKDDFDEETEQLTNEEFAQMMDTLAQQPSRIKGSVYSVHCDDSNASDLNISSAGLAPLDDLITPFKNIQNSCGGGFHSEQGIRPTQEDRCNLLPIVSQMKALQSIDLPQSKKDQLSMFSMACVFDGHSGWRTSQLLSQYLSAILVQNDKFLDYKSIDTALTQTFNTLDYQICRLLSSLDDTSGATGTVAIFDGRKEILTVASVGDSLCVLCRGGRAVEMNKMHRLDNTIEKERVKKNGGTVINNRVNGVLAVSRAFGDIEFKNFTHVDHGNPLDETSITLTSPPISELKRMNESLVISSPEIHSEVITPKTEFAIIATDGLWDVMAPQVVISFIRNKLKSNRNINKVLKELTSEAIARGSVDNVTAAILTFHSSFADP